MAQSFDLSKITASGSQDVDEMDSWRTKYDVGVLIKYGLVGWTYPVECTEAAKGDLDLRTRDWARDAILHMNLRPKAEVGNSEASSSEGASLGNSAAPTSSE